MSHATLPVSGPGAGHLETYQLRIAFAQNTRNASEPWDLAGTRLALALLFTLVDGFFPYERETPVPWSPGISVGSYEDPTGAVILPPGLVGGLPQELRIPGSEPGAEFEWVYGLAGRYDGTAQFGGNVLVRKLSLGSPLDAALEFESVAGVEGALGVAAALHANDIPTTSRSTAEVAAFRAALASQRVSPGLSTLEDSAEFDAMLDSAIVEKARLFKRLIRTGTLDETAANRLFKEEVDRLIEAANPSLYAAIRNAATLASRLSPGGIIDASLRQENSDEELLPLADAAYEASPVPPDLHDFGELEVGVDNV